VIGETGGRKKPKKSMHVRFNEKACRDFTHMTGDNELATDDTGGFQEGGGKKKN